MSAQITTAFVQQYNSNVYMLSQQQGSLLQGSVRKESQKGKTEYFDQVGTVAAVLRTGRHSSTPQIDTPHARRAVTLADYEWGDMIDEQDKIRTLIDPTSNYALAAAWAFGRSKDDVIITAAFAASLTGETGSTTVAHPNSQKFACYSNGAFSDLNVRALRAIRRILRKGEVSKDIPLHIAVTSSQVESLLGQTEVTSSDYNTVKALVQGDIDTYMGFKFHDIERLNATTSTTASVTDGTVGAGTALSGTNRACIAWAQDGLLMSTGEDYTSRISERGDKGYSTQVYSRMSIGATRMEEVKVVEVICKEA